MSAPATRFAVSPFPERTPQSRTIRTAACLIIGDEILNGKTQDTNSHYFAKFCFGLGIDLKRIEVIADDEKEIIEASRRLVSQFDLVVTSGGIGPTHDDITYESLAKAFGQELKYHEETQHRMGEMSKHRSDLDNQTEAQNIARLRMTLFPADAEVLFVAEDLWVPVVRLEKKLCILPGVPSIFKRLLEGLKPYALLPDSADKLFRLLVRTEMAESLIAPFLTDLSIRVKPEGIRIGSYPEFRKNVTVSLVGKDVERLRRLGEEQEMHRNGHLP
ncbi:MoaB/Mog domain-containing protein [Cantharellus anzutake]|uniref:MoaB/Mog domain-containing protein n=1 Tax=Cantharellus anzutake TaxID=1750568 RepID=UPI001907BD7F|nr:MoaB/Mog domain-containing protein [Cantharellus anzutake]KAF8337048.1 MoaB/Mog domain-containing protein [Cantharellus anzutake]